MKFIANLIWFVFGGLVSALIWILGGLICCVTIVGIPLGVQLFKFAKLSFAPFGKKVKLHYTKHIILNTIWLLIAGWAMMLVYLFAALLCCVTIVGIPAGFQALKFSKLALAPFGAEVTKR